jgi:glycosyltransferase involved in cell wall biosynthesis
VTIHRINNAPSRAYQALNALTRSRFRHLLASLEGSLRIRRTLKASLVQQPLDIVQSTNYGLLCLLAGDLVPTVIRCSSYRPLWDQYDRISVRTGRRLYTWLENRQYRRAAGVFSPTQLLAGVLEKELGIRDVAVIRTPFFDETRAYDWSLYDHELKGRDYLLYFGRLSHQKGAQVLGEAMPKVWRAFPELQAVFVGEDRHYSKGYRMSQYISDQAGGHVKKLHFYPFLPHEQLYPLISGAKLVVLPSFIDNAPNTLLEAMGLGKPVVGTYGSSMDEFIEHGVSGFLARNGDSNDLAEKICQALAQPHLAEIGEAARKAMGQFHPDRIIPQLVAFYERAAEKGRSR